MKTTEIKQEITKALKNLGYKKAEELLIITEIDGTRVIVLVNGKRFGIYDLIRHTFVD